MLNSRDGSFLLTLLLSPFVFVFPSTSFANISYDCALKPSNKKFVMSSTGNGVDGFETVQTTNIPSPGDILVVTLDPGSWEFKGKITNKAETFEVQAFDGGFDGIFKNKESIQCHTVHTEPDLNKMAAIAAPKMAEIYNEIASKVLVTRTETSPGDFTSKSTGQSLGERISSADKIKPNLTKCVRYHYEGKAISTVMCMHPTDDMKNMIIFKLGFAYVWDTASDAWTPSVWGWDDDGGDPIIAPLPAK